MNVANPFAPGRALVIPDNTLIAKMRPCERLDDAEKAIRDALAFPISSESLESIALSRIRNNADANAVIVVSDNTRPVPYKGEEGILLPLIRILLRAGFNAGNITVLIATGTHKAVSDGIIRDMFDEEVFRLGIRIANHDCRDQNGLSFLGFTPSGTKVMINSIYMQADLKILTGLVESHFMAGVSGGRKAICPGIIGEESTYIFHGPELMDSEQSRNLNLDGNPVHEESLAVARLAGADFIVNVTLDDDFHLTGVFAGELEKAHLAAVGKLRESVEVRLPYKADIVITHGGFVGINHYQCAKCAVAASQCVKEGGSMIILANTSDRLNPVGNSTYRACLALMRQIGHERFTSLIKSPSWTFIPDQWEVQQWVKVFRRIPVENLYLYSPFFQEADFDVIPGVNAASLAEKGVGDMFQTVLDASLADIACRTKKDIRDLSIIYIDDGPYSVPVVQDFL